MKNNLAKMLSALMIVTALLGFAAVLPTLAVIPQPNAYIIVDPAMNSFPPPSMIVGSKFYVNVSLVNITDVGGVEFHLTWDPTLLQVTTMTEILFHTKTPSAKWGNIWNLQFTYNNTAGKADYSQTWSDGGQAQTDGYAPLNVTTVTDPPAGKLACAAFEFQILKLPTMAEHNLTCSFHFTTVKIGDMASPPNKLIDTPTSTGNPPVDGTYVITWAPPSPLPYFSVSSYTAHSLGEVFNVYVYVNNLDPGREAVGFEFKLSYNATLLTLNGITVGPWLPPFGVFPDQGTLNMTNPSSGWTGWVQHGQVVMPDGNGTWHVPFPSASNPNSIALAVLNFTVIMQGVFPTTYSCPLHLYDTKVGNWLAAPIGQGNSTDGVYTILPSITGRYRRLHGMARPLRWTRTRPAERHVLAAESSQPLRKRDVQPLA